MTPSITMSDATTRGILIRSSHTTRGFSVYAMRIPTSSEMTNACAHSSANTTAITARIASARPRASTGMRTTGMTGSAAAGAAC